jgi:hypothetical protein
MPTLRDLRRGLADRVAPFELATTGISSGGVYSGVALSANRHRVVSSDLVSVSASGITPETPADALKNEWAYLLSDPPEQRRVPEEAYIAFARADEVAEGYAAPPETEAAYFDVERTFAAVVPAGLEVELHGIPPLRGGRQAGLHAAINRALRIKLREDTLHVVGVSGSYRYDLTSLFPWLSLAEQFVDARFPEGSVDYDTAAVPGAVLRFDAEKVLLSPNTTLTTGQTLPVRVLRPLSSWIKPQNGPAAGTWVESTSGLVDELDECTGDADGITLLAAFYIAEAQADACVVGSPEQAYWIGKAGAYAARTVSLRDQRTRAARPTQGPFPDNISPYGPYAGRWGPGFR